MDLKEAKEWEREVDYLKRIDAENAITIEDYRLRLDAEERRVTELENELNQEIESVALGIKLQGDRTQELKKMETQRDALLEAAIGVLKIVQRAYHSDDRGPGDKCSKLEDAIEMVTGKKWWEAIKTKDVINERSSKP